MMSGFGGFGGFGFGGFDIMFTLMFILFIVVFVTVIGKGLFQWNKNNNSPRLTVDASIVSKRTNVSHSSHAGGTNGSTMTSSSSTTYYVTFQVPSGDRMELRVKGSEFGMLAEGDQGKLTFQGTRYLSFERVY